MILEHINLSVSDLERSICFYRDLFDFGVRWRGTTTEGAPAAHVGNESVYLALFEAREKGARSLSDHCLAGRPRPRAGFVVW